jgi:hypothetical protein
MRLQKASVVIGVAIVLASAVTAAGCTIYRDEPAAAPRPAAPPPQAPPPQAPPPQPPAPVAVRPAAPPPPAAPGHKMELHLGGATIPAASATAAPSAGPAACLDQGAVAIADCSTLQAPSPTCAAFTTAGQKCAAYKNNLDPKVAAATMSCLASSTAAQLCDTTRPLACAKAALAQACPDPNVTQLCQIAAGPCKTTPADCATTLSGLNSQGQQAVAQCVATGCSAGLAGCVDGLK